MHCRNLYQVVNERVEQNVKPRRHEGTQQGQGFCAQMTVGNPKDHSSVFGFILNVLLVRPKEQGQKFRAPEC